MVRSRWRTNPSLLAIPGLILRTATRAPGAMNLGVCHGLFGAKRGILPARRQEEDMTQKIVTNLWFDTEAEQAAEFYCSIFPNSKIVSKAHYTEAAPRKEGMVMVVEWELDGVRFVGINGGPQFKFDEAMS